MDPLEIFDDDFAANPWPALARLRTNGDGVHRIRTPDGPPAWLVTRYPDVRAGLLDDRLSTRPADAADGEYRGFSLPPQLDQHLLAVSPEVHRALRALVTTALSPRYLESRADTVDRLAARTVAALGSGPVRIVDQLAIPLPAALLGDLLGLTNDETTRVTAWATSTLRPGTAAPRARDTLAAMLSLLHDVLAHHAECGGDAPVCKIVAHAHDDRESITEPQRLALLFYLIFVWYEPLTDAIAGAVTVLATHPDLAEHARANPAAMRTVVEELLRHLSPQMLAAPRAALTDLTIGDTTIPAGQVVLLGLGAANHDPDPFPDPETLDLNRPGTAHLALGHGHHACMGPSLVRTVLSTTLHRLLQQRPHLHLAEDIGPWRSGFRHRGPHEVVLADARHHHDQRAVAASARGRTVASRADSER